MATAKKKGVKVGGVQISSKSAAKYGYDSNGNKVSTSSSVPGGSGEEGVPVRNAQQENPNGYYGTKENPNPGIDGNPSAKLFGGSSKNSLVGAPTLIFPPVLSSKAAQTKINTKIKPTLDEAKKGIEEQRSLLRQQQQADAEAAVTGETSQLDNATRQAKLEEIKQKTLLIQKELQGEEEKPFAGEKGTITDTGPQTGPVETPKSPFDIAAATEEDTKALNAVTEAYYKEAKNVSNTIKKISSGAIKLSAGEQAQVDGLSQQYQALIDEQKQINQGAVGIANVRGYQTGAAEYDANFQVKTIGAIATKGIQKVADLSTQMASAVAELESSFKKDKISAVKDAFEAYEKAAEKRQEALQSTIKATSDAIKEARKAQEDQQKAYFDQVTKPINDLIKDAAKGGASPEVIAQMQLSGDVGSAAALAGNYLQTGAYAEMVQAFRSAGLPAPSVAQFYADKLGDPGVGGEVPFDATIQGAAALAGSVTGEKSALKDMQNLAKSGDYKSLLTRMESLGRKGMGAEQGKDVFAAQNQIKSITDLQKVLDEYEAHGGQLGPLPATSKALSQKLGQMGADPRFTELATRMTAAFQKYRQELSGAAFGAAESAAYQSVLPTGEKSFALNKAVINGLKEFLNNNVNNAYTTQLGDGYSNLKEYVDKGLTPQGAYLLKTEEAAREKVRELGSSDPTFRAQVQEMIVNNPDLSNYDILEVMGVPVSTTSGPVSMGGNRPQRNNNPGNVKSGGLADKYAAKNPDGSPKTDEQGHLIFATADAGLNALKSDINAKVSGNSPAAQAKLGKQAETLAELNIVYAEDPNWKNNVAAVLGVSPNARLASIPKDKLINAIMQAEGYYA